METVVVVDLFERDVSVLGASGAIVGCTLVVAGEVVGCTMSAVGSSAAFAGRVVKVAVLAAEG